MRNVAIVTRAVLAISILVLPSLWFAGQEERTLVEEWTVQVLDASRAPIEGIRVSEDCSDYTMDWDSGGDNYTNAQGTVVFPPRVLKATRYYWAVAPIWTRLKYGVHASSGITAHVSVSDLKALNTDSDACANKECSRHPLESVLRVKLRAVQAK
jgi:hypothetical protein